MKFYFRELGDPDAETIMINHGWLGRSEHWLNIGKFLADCNYHVIIPDLPNHGHSFHTDSFSYESMANFLHDFLVKHSKGKSILIGHSMGGKIAMKMLDLHPESYEKIIVVDILPKSYPELCVRGSIADTILQTDLTLFQRRQELLDYFKSHVSDKGWLALLMQNIEVKKKSLHWRSNAVLLAESMNEVAGSPVLKKSSVPALLICGSESEFTKKEDRVLFSSVYECSRIIEIEGASHWVFVDRPAAFLKEIAMYLK